MRMSLSDLFNDLKQDQINVSCTMSLFPYEIRVKKQHHDNVVIHFAYILKLKLS